MKLPFVGGAYAGRSLNVDAQTCINLMVDKDTSTPEGTVLVGTPGYSLLADGGTKPSLVIRGLLYPGFGTLTFAVAGNQFWQIEMASGTPVWTRRDTAAPGTTLSTNTGPVSMIHSGPVGKQILIADGAQLHYYSYAGAPTFSQVTSPSAVKPNTVAFQDGRGILDDQNNPGRFYYTNLLDFSTITAFSFASAEGSPDTLTGVFVDRRELYLVGYQTTEIWFNSGDANNPYQRYQGGFIQYGTACPYTIQRCGNTIYWLGRTERGEAQVVRLASNYQVEHVSTPQIEYQLNYYTQTTNISTSYAMAYQISGHDCYVLKTPQKTYVFDTTMNEWHVWRSGSSNIHDITCTTTAVVASARQNLMATSAADGKLYELNADAYDDAGVAIQRERVIHHLNSEQDRIRLSSLQLDMEEGSQTTAVETSALVSVPAVNTGATTVKIGSGTIALYTAGRTVAINMDDGTVHLATIVSNDGAATVTFTEPTFTSAGTGNRVELYEDDRVTIEWSKNGGQSWSNPIIRHIALQLTVAGGITQATINIMKAWRIMVFKLGVARQWTFRIRTSMVGKVIMRGLYAKAYSEPDLQNKISHYASGGG